MQVYANIFIICKIFTICMFMHIMHIHAYIAFSRSSHLFLTCDGVTSSESEPDVLPAVRAGARFAAAAPA